MNNHQSVFAMYKWIIMVILCTISSIISAPISRAINKKVSNRFMIFLIEFVIGVAILMSLYGIVALCGYDFAD